MSNVIITTYGESQGEGFDCSKFSQNVRHVDNVVTIILSSKFLHNVRDVDDIVTIILKRDCFNILCD